MALGNSLKQMLIKTYLIWDRTTIQRNCRKRIFIRRFETASGWSPKFHPQVSLHTYELDLVALTKQLIQEILHLFFWSPLYLFTGKRWSNDDIVCIGCAEEIQFDLRMIPPKRSEPTLFAWLERRWRLSQLICLGSESFLEVLSMHIRQCS